MAGPDADTIHIDADSLRASLETERSAHATARAQLSDAAVREAINEAAWSAIQAELQRKLICRPMLRTASRSTR